MIIDDLLATGGTAKCVSEMLKKENKEILALSVIIELTELRGKDNLDIPVYSEIKYIFHFNVTFLLSSFFKFKFIFL